MKIDMCKKMMEKNFEEKTKKHMVDCIKKAIAYIKNKMQ
jgi:hypothetical protein